MAKAKDDLTPPSVEVPSPETSPVREIKPEGLVQLGGKLSSLFNQYRSDRRIAELRWLRNQRQYLGIYDPEIEKELSPNRSKAYPRMTRVKCISVLSRLMNLMFPGNERNWELKADPWADMQPEDVQDAVQKAIQKDQEAGTQPNIDRDYIKSAIKQYCDDRAKELSELIDGQLQEVGGDQTYDYIALNRKVVRSGIQYGMGVLSGPYAKKSETVTWDVDEQGRFSAKKTEFYKPTFDFVRVWDFYPDMSANTLSQIDGYFLRHVMSRGQLKNLARREDYFEDQIDAYLAKNQVGNYRPEPFEWELRTMGVKVNVNEMKPETMKYVALSWHGKVSGSYLQMCGADVPDDKISDDLDAEIWFLPDDGVPTVIKAIINPWRELGVNVSTAHIFLFDEDDTSPIGFGLPNAVRDSQMMVASSTRMMLDNASVVCGPVTEVNLKLLRPDQDLTAISAYKVFYRDDDDPATISQPAVRDIRIDAHLPELQSIVKMGMEFADAETFVGPATGGDMAQAPSEPMRTAAGASMLRGDAALPFKDIVRAFDQFTQSVITSLVWFNRKLNPDVSPEAEYDVIARGATSLIAKELRGMQADQMVQIIRPEQAPYVDWQKLTEGQFKARDMDGMMVPDDEAKRRIAAQSQQAAQAQQGEQALNDANVKKLLADAFKNIAQGQKNTATADATSVKAALDILERHLNAAGSGGESEGTGDSDVPQLPQGDGGGAPSFGTPSPMAGMATG